MQTSQKGALTILLIILIVVLAGAVGYLLVINSAPEVAPETSVSPSATVSTTPPIPTTQTDNKSTVTIQADTPRVITCNPKSYDPTYFQREKPCVSDMSVGDIERERHALVIIDKAIAATPSLKYTYGSGPKLFVSDQQYVVLEVNMAPGSGYVVVDIITGKVTDYFRILGSQFIENSAKRFVFLDWSEPTYMVVRQYTFGKEKSVTLAGTEVYDPQTYLWTQGPMGSASVNILASTSNSITLGIYNSQKSLPQKPGDDGIEFEQVGTKVINLSS